MSPAPHRPSPVAEVATPVDGVDVLGTLSPSRAADFMQCPLLYRFRTVDRLPEEPSEAAARGTVVHKVLEDLFDMPALERTPERARSMLPGAWEGVVEAEPELGSLFHDAEDAAAWMASCEEVLERYFSLEDPRRLEPAEREVFVEALLDSKLMLRGIIDRVDVSPSGLVRLSDYKSGRSPGERFEAKALFQMRFYALVVWRTRGVLPAMLQLIYLGNGEILRYVPDEADLRATERKLEALWRAIRAAEESGDWRPSPSRLCAWCSHQDKCPAFGDSPPLPEVPAGSTVLPISPGDGPA